GRRSRSQSVRREGGKACRTGTRIICGARWRAEESDLDATVGLDVGGDEPAAAELGDAYHGGDARNPALPAGVVLTEDQAEVDLVADLGLPIGRKQHTGLTDVSCHTRPALELYGKVNPVPPGSPPLVRHPRTTNLLFQFGHGPPPPQGLPTSRGSGSKKRTGCAAPSAGMPGHAGREP